MHLSFVILVEESGKVGGTDALTQNLLPEKNKLVSLTLWLFFTASRGFVLTTAIREVSGAARNISKITP